MIEIREIILTARVSEPLSAHTEPSRPEPRELIEACLVEVRRLLERRERR